MGPYHRFKKEIAVDGHFVFPQWGKKREKKSRKERAGSRVRTLWYLSLSLCQARCHSFNRTGQMEAQLTHTLRFVPFRTGHGNC